jgi:hypothetical protein
VLLLESLIKVILYLFKVLVSILQPALKPLGACVANVQHYILTKVLLATVQY